MRMTSALTLCDRRIKHGYSCPPRHSCASHRRVEEQAEKDEDMRALLEGARGDAAEIARRIKQALQANHAEMSAGGQSSALDDIMQRRRAGETRPVRVRCVSCMSVVGELV